MLCATPSVQEKNFHIFKVEMIAFTKIKFSKQKANENTRILFNKDDFQNL